MALNTSHSSISVIIAKVKTAANSPRGTLKPEAKVHQPVLISVSSPESTVVVRHQRHSPHQVHFSTNSRPALKSAESVYFFLSANLRTQPYFENHTL